MHIYHPFLFISLDPVPLKLFGEGNFAITDIKEVKVTEDFLSLDEATRRCRQNSDMEQCHTNTFIEKANAQCSCSHPLEKFFPGDKEGRSTEVSTTHYSQLKAF